jgi:hypothetical protein
LIMIGLTVSSSLLLEVICHVEKLGLMPFKTIHQRENSLQSRNADNIDHGCQKSNRQMDSQTKCG